MEDIQKKPGQGKKAIVYTTTITTETDFGMGFLTGSQEINYGGVPSDINLCCTCCSSSSSGGGGGASQMKKDVS